MSDYRAGDPQKTTLKWVGLKPCEIQNKLGERNWEVSTYLIKELLKQGGYAQRSYLKSACLKNVPNRNEQFEKISSLKAHFLHEGLPVLSIDTKKKELLGNFYRKGTYYDLTHRKVNDHDFRSQADGIVIPHGIYDVGDNFGYLSLGNSKDTSAFVCDNLAYFWQNDLQWKYPNAQALLILCDGGGSNNASHYIVKQDLYWLAQKLDIDILVAHYPPYCSKWNPIEHRLFCHVHRAWEGAVFQNMELVKELAEMTTTSTGLGIKVRINDKEYQTKRQASPKFKNHIEKFVQFDEKLPKWNYWVKTRKRKVIF
ncbi:MAG: ISAzo13 family transposase [Trichodesmium sp. St19_bin1]|nr:ISAzo13 family transposase [Trichodesmium sp. St19_bin1]